ncbi:MAG: hypothetical protein QOI38_1750 [Sphingomonadales bacterium]|jgi:hypothetical protein|nr:hypothetical protein [Sphingomonadales bacterium]
MNWKPLNTLAVAAAVAGALAAGIGLLLGTRRPDEPEKSGEEEAEAHPS